MFFLQAAATKSLGGIETTVQNYSRMFAESEVPNAILYRGPSNTISKLKSDQVIAFRSVSYFRACSFIPMLSKQGRELCSRIGREPAALIVHSDLLLMPLKRILPHALTVAICHSDRIDKKQGADVIIVLNEQQYDFALRRFPEKKSHIHLLGNPIALDEGWKCSEEYGPIERIVFCARMVPMKDPLALLAAYSHIHEPKPPLAFYGDGPLLPELRLMAQNMPSVSLEGWVREPWSAISPRDLLVMPSRWEGLPYLAQEALLRGVPVIASNIAGHRAALKNGAFGALFDLNDPHALARIIRNAIVNPGPLRSKVSLARLHIEENYALKAFLERLMDVITLAAEHRAPAR
jgi:glycosyltransferase involved in cell wall biosynthesis